MMRTLLFAVALGLCTMSPALTQTTKPATPLAPVVIRAADVPLYDVYAWERWGNFINAQAGSKTEIPYDAARLQVKVYSYPTGEVRAIRFNNAVRTHRHINMTDTILYSWQARRVQFVNNMAVLAEPGDFAYHQKGVDHSGEEIRRGGGIDLEFAVNNPGRHNDPTGYWSFARDQAIQPAALWTEGGKTVETIGNAAAQAPSAAARYRVRIAPFDRYPAREVYLDRGTVLASRDPDKDRLLFVLSGKLTITVGGTDYRIGPEDTARAERGTEFKITADQDSKFVQTSVPPLAR